MPTPRHALHIHFGKLHHWSAFQQPAPHQCQKVHLVFKTTNPNTLHLHSLEQPCSTYIPPKEPQKHLSLYGHALLVTHQHWHPGEDSTTNKRPPQDLWGIQHVVAALNWFLTRKENTFFNHPVEMFSLWANFRNIHRPILRLVFLRAKGRKAATCLNKRSLSTSTRVQCKLLSKKQFENRAVKAVTVI